MRSFPQTDIQLRLKKENNVVYVFDEPRKKWVVLTPEEHVRQLVYHSFISAGGFPPGMIASEKQIEVGGMNKRFDLVVYDREHQPWMLIECKAPEVVIGESTLFQLLNYQRTMQCRYWLITNGHQSFCADAADPAAIVWLDELPSYDL